MIVDGHVHISADGLNPLASIDNVLKKMDETGTDWIVAFPLSTKAGANKELAEVVRPHSDRILQLAFINPKNENAVEEFLMCLDEYGMRGLKLHTTLNDYHIDDVALLDPLLSICNERKLNVVIHCTTDDHRVHPYRIETIAKLYPNATFQIAHMGAVWAADQAIAVAKRNDNVYLDTGIASFNAVRRAMIQVPDKVIMGADFPFYMFEMEQMKIKCAFDVVQSEEAYYNALGKNACRLYHKEEE